MIQQPFLTSFYPSGPPWPHLIYSVSLLLSFSFILNHFHLSPLSLSLHSAYFLHSIPVELCTSPFVYWCVYLSIPASARLSFSILNKKSLHPSCIMWNPSVTFSLSSCHHSLIPGFICLSLAHLHSVYPAWFYLHQNAGTHTGKYSLFLRHQSPKRCPSVSLISSCFQISLLFWTLFLWVIFFNLPFHVLHFLSALSTVWPH